MQIELVLNFALNEKKVQCNIDFAFCSLYFYNKIEIDVL